MAGRGRGGRGGRGRVNMSFNVEQLGFTPGEALPGPVLQPPPTFPPMVNKPVALQTTPETDYLLTLKRDFIQFLHDSPAYLQHEEAKKDIERFSDRYQSLSHTERELDMDWSCLPRELHPAATRLAMPKKRKASKTACTTPAKKDIDVVRKLEELEKTETHTSDAEEEAGEKDGAEDEDEAEEKEEADGVEEEDLDEEMDEGTDYINNYFDNGESYLDEEDDNLDDGPVY